MNIEDLSGYATAVLLAIMFGSTFLYIIDLFRLGRMLQSGKIRGFDAQLKSRLPLESPIVPAFRALMKFMFHPKDIQLSPDEAKYFINCRRLLMIGGGAFVLSEAMMLMGSQY